MGGGVQASHTLYRQAHMWCTDIYAGKTQKQKIKINKQKEAMTAAAVPRNLDYLEVETKERDMAFEFIAIQYMVTSAGRQMHTCL